MTQKSKNGIAFFERGSWYHRIRWYDEDYLVRYGKKEVCEICMQK
ncbi:MAG: hypothetical protein ACLTVV_15905 [Ruminococcus sp.]